MNKISVSLPENTMHFIASYLSEHKEVNRSQMIQKALRLLQEKELEMAYKEANPEINKDFDLCAADGLDEAW